MTALREQMTDDMVLRGLSGGTQKAYLRVVTRLATYYGRSPDRISEREIQTYLLHLYREKGFSHSTCNVAVAGLRFFYPVTLRRPSTGFVIPAAREPSKLPEILTREDPVPRSARASVRGSCEASLCPGQAAGGNREGRRAAHPSSHLCDAPARSRRQPPHAAAPPGAQEPALDDALPPSRAAGGGGRAHRARAARLPAALIDRVRPVGVSDSGRARGRPRARSDPASASRPLRRLPRDLSAPTPGPARPRVLPHRRARRSPRAV